MVINLHSGSSTIQKNSIQKPEQQKLTTEQKLSLTKRVAYTARAGWMIFQRLSEARRGVKNAEAQLKKRLQRDAAIASANSTGAPRQEQLLWGRHGSRQTCCWHHDTVFVLRKT